MCCSLGSAGNSSHSLFASKEGWGQSKASDHLRSTFRSAGDVGDGSGCQMCEEMYLQLTIGQPVQTNFEEDVPVSTSGGIPRRCWWNSFMALWLWRSQSCFEKESHWLGAAEILSKHDTNLRKSGFESDISGAFSSGAAIVAEPFLGTGLDAALRSMHVILKSEKKEAQADLSSVFTRTYFASVQVLDLKNLSMEMRMVNPEVCLGYHQGWTPHVDSEFLFGDQH